MFIKFQCVDKTLYYCVEYFPGRVFNNANQHINVYGDNIEVDYRGYEVKIYLGLVNIISNK